MPVVSVPGGTVFYEVKGQGEPLVLLRGLARSSQHWLGFDERLAAHYRVLTIDARGLGRSKARVGVGLTVKMLADDVVAAMDAAGMPEAHVLGVSLGGMVTLGLGLEHPRRVRSMIIVNSSIAGSGVFRLSPRALLALGRGLLVRGSIHEALANVLVPFERGATERLRIVNEWARIEREEGMGVATALVQLLAALRFRVRRRLPELRVPALVLYGSGDAFVPRRNSQVIFDLLPDAQLRKIMGAGHEPTLSHGAEIIAAIGEFLQGRAARVG